MSMSNCIKCGKEMKDEEVDQYMNVSSGGDDENILVCFDCRHEAFFDAVDRGQAIVRPKKG